jgi:putative FmdB family regulatory protein
MPLYEFRCLKCNEVFEFLVVGEKDEMEMKCPHCESADFERVISTSNFAMGAGKGSPKRPQVESRQCSSGSCSTVTLPGYTKD